MINFNTEGKVELAFTEQMKFLKEYGHNLTSVNLMRKDILFLDYRCLVDSTVEEISID